MRKDGIFPQRHLKAPDAQTWMVSGVSHPRLVDVDLPVLVLVGGEKEYPLSGIHSAENLARIFPNAKLEQVVNSGHFMFAEENEKFQQLVENFLCSNLTE